VPIFETSIQQVNSNIGTSYSLIWNPENTSTTTFGALGSVSSTATLKDVTIMNTGTVTVFAGSGTQTAGGSAGSLAIPVGGQVTIQGYNVTNPSGTTGQIWGNTTTGTGATTAGLASVASVV
jgi:flagellar basal body rod protein FlgF